MPERNARAHRRGAVRIEAGADRPGLRRLAIGAVLAIGLPATLAWFCAVGFAVLWLVRSAAGFLSAWSVGG